MNNMKQAIEEAVVESTPSKNVTEFLSVEQRAALEAKFLTLPIEVRSAASMKYGANLGNVALYIIRQAVKEANGKLASQHRPIWYNTLLTNAASLNSGSEEIRKWAEKQLRELAEELDSKESATLLKKYKNSKDMTSKDSHIIQLCGIFGVETATLK